MLPVLKYVRGEHLSQDHWLDMFRLLGLPRGTTLEKLTFSDLLSVANTIVEKALELKVCLYIGRLGVHSTVFLNIQNKLVPRPHNTVYGHKL